jgi:hypothetical protein
VTTRADFERLIAELASAPCEQDARTILEMNKPVLEWIDDLPTRAADSLMEQIQDIIAELPADE